MPLPTYTAADLEQHRSSRSCYVTVGTKVYDITDFLPDHPGGEDLVLEHAGGKDITALLADPISHEHSSAAYEILQEHHIGFVTSAPSSALPPTPPRTPNPPPSRTPDPNTLTGMSSEEELSIPTDIAADYQANHFLDLRRALLPQIWFGGFPKMFYLEQVHKPRYVRGGASAPLFGNFLEPLSKTPWWVVPTVWLPCVAYGVSRANEGLPGPLVTAALFCSGVAIWTLVEYGLHRCLFHLDEKMPDNRVMITLHFLLHGVHHYLPMDRLRLVMPPALFLILATPFWKLAHLVFFWHWHAGTAVYSGGIFGYVCYDLTHYFLHHKKLPAFYQDLKKYHLEHHYKDYQKGYGVTSKFWDRVFGTELVMGPAPPRVKAE